MPYPNTYFQQTPMVNTINWCQGESGAKSCPVAPGNTVPIFDSEDNVIYIKSVDVMGRPLPLKVLEYTERTTEPKEEKHYIEQETFDTVLSSLTEKMDMILEMLTKPEKKEKSNAK